MRGHLPAFVLFSCFSLFAQDALLQRPDVRKALAFLEANHERHLAKQVQIAEIAAPTFHEAERGKFLAEEFRKLGLARVETDAQGNVLGWREGESPETLVIAAHLDIAFAPGVNVKVRKEGGRWYGPGLADDSRGLAALLAIVEAMNDAAPRTRRTLLFVANVAEEGLGDLAGVKYLFQNGPHRDRLKAFISIDGTNPARIANGGTGVKRYRITLRGPGGHSYGNFGRPSPIHAAARATAQLADLEVPASPKTTFNVGRINGGTSVNAIAEECWFEVDLRSEDPGQLDKIELALMSAVRLGVEAENTKRAPSGAKVSAETKLVGMRPAGKTDEGNALVKSAAWSARALGFTPEFRIGSTDSNLPMSLGIPAVTLGGGGRSDNAHSLNEWFEPAGAWKGPQMVLLTLLAHDSSSMQ
ncbi:MAG TPA: M20/M25/M40 family metallo-hydrolase [Bryobacteraceae bacterium]|nr:M20/M25/M40 family metallo-hydrolase [Bryobacteraceae bacterium]